MSCYCTFSFARCCHIVCNVTDNHGASPVLGRESVKTVEDSYQEEKEMLEDSENAGENPTEPSDVNKIQQDFVEQLFQASPSNSSSYRDSSNSGLNISPSHFYNFVLSSLAT